MRITGKKKIKLAIIPLLVVLLIIAFWNGLVVRNYVIHSDKLITDKIVSDIRIVLITDLHSHIYGKNQKHIADKIKKSQPDLIFLSGDIADDKTPIEGTKQFLAAVSGVAPIYYVSGNHEFWSNDIENIKKIIRGYGVTILENTYEIFALNGNEIIIGGVDDPDGYKGSYDEKGVEYLKEKLKNNYTDWDKSVNEAFTDLYTDERYKILLSHRPEKVDLYADLPFDMILSGHAHGGQVRIPFIMNGLIAPNQGFFPKYAGGLYEYNGKKHIVSRGVSFNRWVPRVFNPPEIVVITLKH